MNCNNCGKKLSADAVFCPHCGTNIVTGKKAQSGAIEIIRRVPPPFILLASLILAWIGQLSMYGQQGTVWVGLVFFALAAALFLTVDFTAKYTHEITMPVKFEMILFVGIIALAVFFRTYNLHVMPPDLFADEGNQGLIGVQLMNGDKFPEFNTKYPVHHDSIFTASTLMSYVDAVFFKLFGVGEVQLRLASALVGVLAVASVYFIARMTAGQMAALFSGYLMAVMRWHVNYSRMGYIMVASVLAVAFAIYFGWRAYKHGNLSDFLLFGLANAFAQYGYQPSRIMPAWVFLFGVYVLVTNWRFYRDNWHKILAAAFVFGIFFLPMYKFMKTYPGAYGHRGGATLITNPANVEGYTLYPKLSFLPKTVRVYIGNMADNILALNHVGGWNPRWNWSFKPHVEFFTGIFVILGFFMLLAKLFKPLPFFLLTAIFVLSNAAFLTTENPNSSRTSQVIPVVILMAGYAMARSGEILASGGGRLRSWILTAAGCALLLVIGVNNYREYFIGQMKDRATSDAFSPEETNMARELKKMGPDWRGIIHLRYFYFKTFRFMMGDDKTWINYTPFETIPVRKDDGKNYVYKMVLPENYGLIPILKEIYPNGKYSEFRPKYGNWERPLYFSYEVPNSDVKEALRNMGSHGLDGYYYGNAQWQGKPVTVTVEPFLYFRHYYNPLNLPYSMEWKGKIKIDKPGSYGFALQVNNDSELYIDGKKLITLKNDESQLEYYGTATVNLAAGFHKILVKYSSPARHTEFELRWRPPGEPESVVPYRVLYRQ